MGFQSWEKWHSFSFRIYQSSLLLCALRLTGSSVLGNKTPGPQKSQTLTSRSLRSPSQKLCHLCLWILSKVTACVISQRNHGHSPEKTMDSMDTHSDRRMEVWLALYLVKRFTNFMYIYIYIHIYDHNQIIVSYVSFSMHLIIYIYIYLYISLHIFLCKYEYIYIYTSYGTPIDATWVDSQPWLACLISELRRSKFSWRQKLSWWSGSGEAAKRRTILMWRANTHGQNMAGWATVGMLFGKLLAGPMWPDLYIARWFGIVVDLCIWFAAYTRVQGLQHFLKSEVHTCLKGNLSG